MTGVVEVGFVLAVLPLLVSSVEHYEDIYRPFTRYKNYDPLTRRIQLDLRSEKTAFLTETRLLLLATVGSESAEEMLADLKDPRWAGREYGAAGSQHLGDSLSVCMEVIRAIEEELQKIEASCEKFGILPEGRPLKPVLGVFHRDVWDRKKTKAKFALWAASLQGKLEELRKLNSQFRTHSKQTIRLTSLGNHSKQQQSNGILRTQIVQAASKELYQALVRATECHEAHSIHVRLDVHHVSETSATHSQLGIHPKSDAIPTWLAIESIRQDAFTKADFYQINSQSPFQDLTGVSPSAPTKQTHDHSRSSPSSMKSCGSSTMTNIGANGQICHQLQRYFQSEIGIQDGSGCLGYLESDSYYRHTVYLKPEKPESAKPRHRTLSQFMTSSVRHSRSGRLSTYEKLRLARQLAAAVLHFHATPLTIAPWRSTDVFFLVDIGENNKGPLLMEPHLSVQMRNEEPEGNEMSPQERAIIRNPQLFALGIVLLELAYQTSLEDLHLEYQTEIGSSPIFNDFFLANRLTKDGCMSRELGVTYKEAVRRCIECDFGCGKDLSESTLQAAFYNSVVCELEKLEKHLEKIY